MSISPRMKFVAMFLLFSLPIVASYLTFFFWKPTTTNNFGELLSPVVNLANEPLKVVDGKDAPGASAETGLRGKWLILTVDEGACSAACQQKAYTLRQTRQILGRDQDRVVRVVLVSDAVPINDKILTAYAGTAWVDAQKSSWLSRLPVEKSGTGEGAGTAKNYIYAVDPMGNVFMRYRADVDIKSLVADLKRVLKASQLGKDFEGKIDSVTKPREP